jgi:hypothetical protein
MLADLLVQFTLTTVWHHLSLLSLRRCWTAALIPCELDNGKRSLAVGPSLAAADFLWR